jgi:hypothetical protein
MSVPSTGNMRRNVCFWHGRDLLQCESGQYCTDSMRLTGAELAFAARHSRHPERVGFVSIRTRPGGDWLPVGRRNTHAHRTDRNFIVNTATTKE